MAHKAAPSCVGKAAYFDTRRKPATAGWGLSPGNTRFIPAEIAGLPAGDLPRLEVKWAFAFPGALRVRSQPSVAYGAIYVGSQDGTVYALDLDTGCIRWTFRARAEVRTAIVHEPPAAPHAGSPARNDASESGTWRIEVHTRWLPVRTVASGNAPQPQRAPPGRSAIVTAA